jgi:hypothetical protein
MRYFFELDGAEDDIGTVLESEDVVPREAFRLLLEVASESRNQRSMKVVVRDMRQSPVYEASLQLKGQWRAPETLS